MMDLKNKLLFQFAKGVLARNKKFKNSHKGDSCYIFGNGASLKNMDLAKFSDRVSIGCNHLCLHNDFRALDIRYYMLVEPYFLYPICRNPYTGEIQINHLGNLFKRAMTPHRDVTIFTSISNYFGWRADNIHYLHHFGQREFSLNHCEMDACFSFMKGGLYSMLGAAIYMGFERATLVGCDYTFSPNKDRHFYKKGKGLVSRRNGCIYANLFEEVSSRIDLMTITDDGAKSDVLRYQEYRQFAHSDSKFRDNNEIVSAGYLDLLEEAARKRQIEL